MTIPLAMLALTILATFAIPGSVLAVDINCNQNTTCSDNILTKVIKCSVGSNDYNLANDVYCKYGCIRTTEGDWNCKQYQDDMPIPGEIYALLEVFAFLFLAVGILENRRETHYDTLIFPILSFILFVALTVISFNMMIGDVVSYSLGLVALNFSMGVICFVYIWFVNFRVLGKAMSGEG